MLPFIDLGETVLNVVRIATIPRPRKMSFENDVKGAVGRILEERMQN
jgi:hypothetical protein